MSCKFDIDAEYTFNKIINKFEGYVQAECSECGETRNSIALTFYYYIIDLSDNLTIDTDQENTYDIDICDVSKDYILDKIVNDIREHYTESILICIDSVDYTIDSCCGESLNLKKSWEDN